MALQIPMRVPADVYAAVEQFRKSRTAEDLAARHLSDAARELIAKALQAEGLLPANDQKNDSAP